VEEDAVVAEEAILPPTLTEEVEEEEAEAWWYCQGGLMSISRGYLPTESRTLHASKCTSNKLGGDLKNTFCGGCVLRKGYIYAWTSYVHVCMYVIK